MRLILLNALPLNSIPFSSFAIQVHRASISDIATTLPNVSEVKNYIRHDATVKLLSQLLKINLTPSNELYEFSEDDAIFVITLKKPVRGQEVTEIKPNDLDIFKIVVARGVWL